MAMAHPRVALLTAAASLLFVLPGCGSDDDATSPSSSAPPAPTAAPAASTPAAAPTAAGPEKVEIKDFDYGPAKLSVATGTKVTWTNADAANHTVTFDTGAKENLGNQPKGKSVSMTFTKAGTFAYHCDYHPNMHGTVVVK